MSIVKISYLALITFLLVTLNASAGDIKPLREIDDEAIERWLSQRSSSTRSLRTESRVLEFQVNFEFNSYKLTNDDRLQIERLARIIKSKTTQTQRFTIEGHTDKKGSYEYNLALSTRRADEVTSILVQEGVGSERLYAVGKSFDELVNRNQPFAAENRRVKVILSGN
jgi:outer membrane protein OmpA-like peptidoglycan-associated protein